MSKEIKNNHAFIDSQNLNLGIQKSTARGQNLTQCFFLEIHYEYIKPTQTVNRNR